MAFATSQTTGENNGPVGVINNAFNLDAPVAKYASLGDLATVLAPDVRKDLVKTFGNQGISGLLDLMGATKAVGTADEVTYFEEARLHPIQLITNTGGTEAAAASQTFVAADVEPADDYADKIALKLRVNDLVLCSDGTLAMVTATTPSTGEFTIKSMDGGNLPAVANGDATFPIVGNMYKQGSDQPGRYLESDVVKRVNPFTIVKESYQVSGSNATNIGYIDVGGGDYRWYIKGEMDARQRFLDARELTLLLGTKATAAGVTAIGGEGTEGYFAAVTARGIVATEDGADTLDTVAELDDIIALLDKNGAGPEYAAMLNSALFAQFNSMPAAAGSGASVTSGVAANFGAFQNNQEAAINLGFQSFARGGYTFHLKKMGLLNSPNLMGNANGRAVAKGCMIPLSQVVDPVTGYSAPALELNYKAANGYNREMEHWVTGGGVLGFTNDTTDIAKFHYRSECCLVTRAANQHVLIK
jgi:hypothetical protein|tara:strand:- start:2062 stop:3480 length:1419 start_codon:yes stop_codon:yes gene_type:complete